MVNVPPVGELAVHLPLPPIHATAAAPVAPGAAEFAVWVDDARQGRGVGTVLVRGILRLLAEHGANTAIGIMEPGNLTIRHLVSRVAPEAVTRFEDGMVIVTVPLADFVAPGARS